MKKFFFYLIIPFIISLITLLSGLYLNHDINKHFDEEISKNIKEN